MKEIIESISYYLSNDVQPNNPKGYGKTLTGFIEGLSGLY